MQSNNNPEDPEFEDILNIAYHHGELGNNNACLRPLLEQLIAREHRKTLQARIDEARRYFGEPKWFWGDSPKLMHVSRGEIYERIAELQSQLPKKERTE